MRVGVSTRIAPGVHVYSSVGGAAAGVLLLIVASFELVIGTVLLVLGIFLLFETMASEDREKDRLQALVANSVDPNGLVVTGRYTSPRTWGVYKVPRLIKGTRGSAYYFGNFPARGVELVSRYGEATAVAIYTNRLDAEELAYKLNGGTRRPG